MISVGRVVAISFVFVITWVAWATLGAVTGSRTMERSSELGERIDDLWGQAQVQRPPSLVFHWQTQELVTRSEQDGKRVVQVKTVVKHDHEKELALDATDIDAKLHSNLRRKGLLWYSLYDLGFDGNFAYVHREPVAGTLVVSFAFPAPDGVYDGFRFLVNGVDFAAVATPRDGVVSAEVPVRPDERVDVKVTYQTRGQDAWTYQPATAVGVLKNFNLRVATDFRDFDYPVGTLSASSRKEEGAGYALAWTFDQIVTGKSMGVVTPTRLQPGELAANLSYSAPISLFFFFVFLFVLGALRGIDIHPVNYLLIAAAFFSFHLLFAYSADLLPVEAAFPLASFVSVVLVVSYLRLVVSSTFAYREAALAQLVYLVGFSLAHFWKGSTGLTVTVLAIVTLFIIMQLTGRMSWTEVFAAPRKTAAAR